MEHYNTTIEQPNYETFKSCNRIEITKPIVSDDSEFTLNVGDVITIVGSQAKMFRSIKSDNTIWKMIIWSNTFGGYPIADNFELDFQNRNFKILK